MHRTTLHSPNFDFLRDHNPHLLEYAARAERYVLDDPNTTLIKLRQLAEELAELAAAYTRVHVDHEDGFSELLRKLQRKHLITREMADIFHGLRKAGNAAAHEGAGTRQEAIAQLKLARKLAVWFHQAFRDPDFRPGRFVLPPNPPKISPKIKQELDRLRRERWESEREVDATEEALRKALKAQQEAERRAASMYAELEAVLTLAEETESHQMAVVAEHQARVAELQAQAATVTDAVVADRSIQAQRAADQFDLTEGEARDRIDAQLRARGWEADSVVRTWENGARPQPGRNQAIAFCPAGDGYADYALYCGEHVVGIIEAKRRNIDLRAALLEAENYARNYQVLAEERFPEASDTVPLLFASNGRPYASAEDTLCGIWFRDLRENDGVSLPLEDWPEASDLPIS